MLLVFNSLYKRGYIAGNVYGRNMADICCLVQVSVVCILDILYIMEIWWMEMRLL